LKKANPEIESKLKVYKRSTSMVDIKPRKNKNEQQTTEQDSDEEEPRAKSLAIILR
jgi:hypothetical protein